MSVAQTVKLSSGHAMPLFGLGTWKSKPGEVAAAVKHAIKSGYRWVAGWAGPPTGLDPGIRQIFSRSTLCVLQAH